jgi:hypothetical protein
MFARRTPEPMSRLVEPLPSHPYHRQQAEEERRRLQAAISAAQPGPSRTKPARSGRVAITLVGFLIATAAVTGYVLYRYDLVGFLSNSAGHPSVDDSDSAKMQDVVIFSGRANELAKAPGNTLEEDDSAEPVTWITSSVRTASPSGSTDGVSVKIPSSVSENLQTRQVIVTVSAARKAGADSSAPFALSYSTDSRDTGWRVFQPTSEFKEFSFSYRVPNVVGGTNFIGIWADISGRSIPLAVRCITVSVPR